MNPLLRGMTRVFNLRPGSSVDNRTDLEIALENINEVVESVIPSVPPSNLGNLIRAQAGGEYGKNTFLVSLAREVDILEYQQTLALENLSKAKSAHTEAVVTTLRDIAAEMEADYEERTAQSGSYGQTKIRAALKMGAGMLRNRADRLFGF